MQLSGKLAAIVVTSVAFALSSSGQVFTANLTGLVTDPAGAAIPGVAIKLANAATNEERQTATGEEGRYTFSQLLPGAYELRAEATGFKIYVQRGITLLANQSGAVNFAMQLGEISQRVEIAAAVVQVDTQTANQSVTLNRDMVLSLPTNIRNPLVLVHATAGITAPATGISQSVADQNHDRFGMNGGRSTTTGILLDGVSVNAANGWNGLIYSPSVDSVQEVQVIRNAYDSQFGRSGGGVVSVVTKGGSADFHGTAFDFLRNSSMDANTWANNRGGNRRPQFQRNQFGGNMSGPIWKSKKLFYFGGYEGLRQGTPANSTVTLPTALERSGDFSRTFNPNGTLPVIYDPFSTRPNPNGAGFIRDAFPNNRIPAATFDPVGKNAVALYPESTGPGDPITGARNYSKSGKGTTTSDRSDIRIDWARSEKHTIYGRWSKVWRTEGRPPAGVWQSYGGTGPISGNPRYQITIGNTFVPSPSWVINVLAGHGRWIERQRSDTYGRDGTEIGLPASFVSQLDVKTIPQLYPTNYSNISHSRDLNNISRVDNLQLNVTKEKGLHSLKFGFGRDSSMGTGGGLFSADFSFSRGMTSGPVAQADSSTSGNAIASMLLGTGSSGNVQKPALGATNRVYYAWYFQDSWRISRRLTLNPGLRYEMHRSPTERFNRFSNFHYAVDNPLGPKVGLPLKGGLVFLNQDSRYSWNNEYLNFAPRFGLSYKVAERMVIRAGYGIFHPQILGAGDMTGFSSTTPWVTSRGGDNVNPQDLFRNPYPGGLIPAAGSSLGLETNLGRGAGSFQRDHPNGYMQNYSLDIQYELNRATVLEIGYTGHQGRKLSWGVGLNDNQLAPELLALGSQLDVAVNNPFFGFITGGSLASRTVPRHRLLRPFPQFDSVSRSGQTPGGSSSYNAMLVKLTKQFSSGLMLLSSYQWSKCIDNIGETEPSPGGAADGYRNSRDFRIERSLSAHDLPHSFVTAFVYDLPVGHGRRFAGGMNRVADLMAGGWQVSGIVRFSTGLPVRLTAPSLIAQYGFGTQYPNVTKGSDVALARRTPEKWFNTAAFSAPAPYTVGNSPRRLPQLRADNQKNADLAILKNFRVKERARVQFRAEAFNLTNTPQFAWPDTAFGSTTFGVVSGTMNIGPRNIQMGLKIDF
ncbi:MAG: TonB-dependent receptor [Acidobacteria bacterium]|nr:TonB-dependent receptor [Acidobacteriota bacterium]